MRRRSWNPLLLSAVALVAALSLSAPGPQSADAQTPELSAFRTQVVTLAEYINVYPLTAGDDQVVTIPVGANLAVFGLDGSGTFWIKRATSCAVPTTTITNGTGAEPNPSARVIYRRTGSTSFCIVTDDTGLTVTVSWYKLPS